MSQELLVIILLSVIVIYLTINSGLFESEDEKLIKEVDKIKKDLEIEKATKVEEPVIKEVKQVKARKPRVKKEVKKEENKGE